MSEHSFDPQKLHTGGCIVLIGMAGAGKSTVGGILANRLGWAHMDTDRLMEAYFGAPLQAIMDAFGLEGFLKAEERLVASMGVSRAVISTGGSVVYGPHAMDKLRILGALVYLHADLATLTARISSLAGRALAIQPGQRFADLFAERRPLYANAADLTVPTDDRTPEECAQAILDWLGAAP